MAIDRLLRETIVLTIAVLTLRCRLCSQKRCLCGRSSIGQDIPAVVSARILSARPMVLSGMQRQQNAVVTQDSSVQMLPQACGLLGLKSPADGAFADLLFHDPTPARMFGPAPKKVTTFKIRAGTLVLFPCWLRYDLNVSDDS